MKKKQKRVDIDSIHKKIIKTIGFKHIAKDDLQCRINILLINEKIINKINRNLSSYSADEDSTNTDYDSTQVLSNNLRLALPNNNSTPDSLLTPQTPLKDFETPNM